MKVGHAKGAVYTLDVALFGSPRFFRDGQPVEFEPPPRALSLLAYLSLEPGPAPRDRIAFALWPDVPEEDAKANLRRHLHRLQAWLVKYGFPECIIATQKTLAWNPACAVGNDVRRFLELSGAQHSEEAAGLYGGDVLAGADEEWLTPHRDRLREMQIRNIEAAIAVRQQAGEYKDAIRLAQLALQADPWREESVRVLIASLRDSGDHAGAVAAYRTFESRYKAEFGLEPMAETQAVVLQILEGARRPYSALPAQTNAFVGRTAEGHRFADLLCDYRLVTVCGPGGVGKSRFILHEAGKASERVVYGQLAALHDRNEMLDHLLSISHAGRAVLPLEALAGALNAMPTLLILDNCEHLVESCAEVAVALLERCAHLRIVTTSREPLNVSAEAVLRLAPLAPDEAAALFKTRAQAINPAHFPPAATDLIRAICARLDCIPLAIELAAGHAAALSLAEIFEHLNDRFALLRHTRRSHLAHHDTLRGAIDWSYQLLAPAEQVFMRSLAIFPGSWTLGACEWICTSSEIPRGTVTMMLSSLVAKSLVNATVSEPRTSYTMLESIRAFALEAMYHEDDVERLRTSHAAYFSAEVARAVTQLSEADQKSALGELEAMLDDIRAIMHLGTVEKRFATAGLEMAASLEQFWLTRGNFSEGHRWLEETFAAAPGAPPALRARARSALGIVLAFQDSYAQARTVLAEAIALYEDIGDASGVANAMHALGVAEYESGNVETAMSYFKDVAARAGHAHEKPLLAKALDNLGLTEAIMGAYADSRTHLTESAALCERLGDSIGKAWAQYHLACLAEHEGAFERSLQLHKSCLIQWRELGHDHGSALSLQGTASASFHLGELDAALQYYRDSIQILLELKSNHGLAQALEGIARIACARERFDDSAELLGAARALRQRSGTSFRTDEGALHQTTLDTVRAAIGPDAFEQFEARGAEDYERVLGAQTTG